MELGHLLTRSGLTYPEVSSKVCHDSFCQLGNSVSLPWVIYYEAGILFTCCIQFPLYSSNLSKIGVIFNSFTICVLVVSVSTLTYTVWHVDKYKITFKLAISHWTNEMSFSTHSRILFLLRIFPLQNIYS